MVLPGHRGKSLADAETTYGSSISVVEFAFRQFFMIAYKTYGCRNMNYVRLKIMQVCGYLNSKFIPHIDYLMEAL